MRLLHLSDIHLRQGWYEEQGVVLSAFVEDVKKNVRDIDYFVISGDLVRAGEHANDYDSFEQAVLKNLRDLGMTPAKTILVPGNHDVDAAHIRDNIPVLQGLPLVHTNELSVNNYLNSTFGRKSTIKRLENYAAFESTASQFGAMSSDPNGSGHDLGHGIGVFCLNSAVFSYGGQKDVSGEKIVDEGQLVVETRNLQKWLQETKFDQRILVVHHPPHVLVSWAATELETIAQRHFRVVLSGHLHQTRWGQQASAAGTTVYLAAPALFTRKADTLGYTCVDIDVSGLVRASYRQWVQDGQKFVTGTVLSRTDSGAVQFEQERIAAVDPLSKESGESADRAEIAKRLQRYFDNALTCYPHVSGDWISLTLSPVPQGVGQATPETRLTADDLILLSESIVVKAPPQFGLTTLGRYIALKRYEIDTSKVPLFIDSKDAPNHESGLEEYCRQKLEGDFGTTVRLGSIILDNWDHNNPLKVRQLDALRKTFDAIPLVVLATLEDVSSSAGKITAKCKSTYRELYVWTLTREQIWYLVDKYVQRGSQLEVDQAVTRVADHLEALNLHRTPLNVLLLLVIFENVVDYSPVNRTELIDGILQVTLAHLQKVPRYNTIPDSKDTKFALGYFCKFLVKDSRIAFYRADLVVSMQEYSKKQRVDFDLDLLVGCLEACGIIVPVAGGRMAFRFTYWMYYFAAFQMHVDDEFYEYMVAGRRYSAYFEVIEFFCGIDRRGNRLIETILSDLTSLNDEFQRRSELAPEADYFKNLPWDPTTEYIEDARTVATEQTEKSALPAPLKHAIADSWYDPQRPYNQELRVLLDDSSLANCRRVMTAASRALRNCDHGDPKLRTSLLAEVMRTWGFVFNVISILAPVLAKDGYISYEGWGAFLGRSFDPISAEDKLSVLISVIPSNLARFYRADLYSPKTSPLLFDFNDNSTVAFQHFVLCTMFIQEKPRGWEDHVQRHLQRWDRKSFYLWATLRELVSSYRTGFHKSEDSAALRRLIGYVAGRHRTSGNKTVDGKTIEVEANKLLGKESLVENPKPE